MRFFRVPAFSGIEVHRDDADRGSLRVVEGCLPHGPGGMRSSPVWTKLGELAEYAKKGEANKLTAADDEKGNSAIFASQDDEVHDMGLFTTEGIEFVSINAGYPLVSIAKASLGASLGSVGLISSMGNGAYTYGNGTDSPVAVGKGVENVAPDVSIYSMEYSYFPKCTDFIIGPRKCLFAAGNPDQPLRVYVSEPAGKTTPFRDSPYSTEHPAYSVGFEPQVGLLSTVDIIGSNATKITGLSTRANQVVVHTDKGCHLLYASKEDQASTGFRVEQAPATNFSAAVNNQVVAGEGGPMAFWLGHDSQIYKDSSATRGAEDTETFTDTDQVSYKAKGGWESEHPANLWKAFATYEPQSGMYWVFIENPFSEEGLSAAPEIPVDSISTMTIAVDIPVPTAPVPAIGYQDIPTESLKELYDVDYIDYASSHFKSPGNWEGEEYMLQVINWGSGISTLIIHGDPAGTATMAPRNFDDRPDALKCFVLGDTTGEVTVKYYKTSLGDYSSQPLKAEFKWNDQTVADINVTEDGSFTFTKDAEDAVLYIRFYDIDTFENRYLDWLVYVSAPV